MQPVYLFHSRLWDCVNVFTAQCLQTEKTTAESREGSLHHTAQDEMLNPRHGQGQNWHFVSVKLFFQKWVFITCSNGMNDWFCSSQCTLLFISLASFPSVSRSVISSRQASCLNYMAAGGRKKIGFKCQERWQKWLTCFCFPVCVISLESWQRWSCHGGGEGWWNVEERCGRQQFKPLCSRNTSLCNSTALAGVEPETFGCTRVPTPWNTPISHGHLIYFLITLDRTFQRAIFRYIFLNCMYFCLLGKTDLSLLLQ